MVITRQQSRRAYEVLLEQKMDELKASVEKLKKAVDDGFETIHRSKKKFFQDWEQLATLRNEISAARTTYFRSEPIRKRKLVRTIIDSHVDCDARQFSKVLEVVKLFNNYRFKLLEDVSIKFVEAKTKSKIEELQKEVDELKSWELSLRDRTEFEISFFNRAVDDSLTSLRMSCSIIQASYYIFNA